MLFNSPQFLFLFLPISLIAYYTFARIWGGRSAQISLILSSCIFYAVWDWVYLFMLIALTAINFNLARYIQIKKSKYHLIGGIFLNISILFYFKYTNFGIQNINEIFGTEINYISIILPLGISFFTFQKIAYLVDAYQGKVHDNDPLRFSLFVLFFPQLIAGPIVHHSQIIPQLIQNQKIPFPHSNTITKALFYFSIGLFKKVVIADNIAGTVDPIFNNVENIHFIEAWTAAIGYSLQLYFDFSAYSEMAIGIALLFGIQLPINFNSPYKATSITDFWRRWHITLGAFMKHYIYIPLGGKNRIYAASLLTMIIGGIWHGASWTFILWGFLHGLMLVTHKYWNTFDIKINTKIALTATLLFVVFTWIPFRATSIQETLFIWEKMIGFGGISLPSSYQSLFSFLSVDYHFTNLINGFEIIPLVLLFIFVITARNTHEIYDRLILNYRSILLICSSFLVCFFALSKPTTFMYFQF